VSTASCWQPEQKQTESASINADRWRFKGSSVRDNGKGYTRGEIDVQLRLLLLTAGRSVVPDRPARRFPSGHVDHNSSNNAADQR